jgi:hypothetical protein
MIENIDVKGALGHILVKRVGGKTKSHWPAAVMRKREALSECCMGPPTLTLYCKVHASVKWKTALSDCHPTALISQSTRLLFDYFCMRRGESRPSLGSYGGTISSIRVFGGASSPTATSRT